MFLEKVLEKAGCLPVRNIMNKKELSEIFAHIDTLIIDVTEQRITRPSNKDIQADYYSGKKGVEQHPKLKRYRILSERLRTQSFDFYDKMSRICAGLWNFYLASISL